MQLMAENHLSSNPLMAAVLIIIGMSSLAGCRGSHRLLFDSAYGAPATTYRCAGAFPGFPCLADESQADLCEFPWPTEDSDQRLAEQFLELAESLRSDDDSRSTDYFFQAAVHSWQAISQQPCRQSQQVLLNMYQASVTGLITEAVRFGRLERGRLSVYLSEGPVKIPVVATGMPWPSEQFSDLQLVKASKHRKLKRYFCAPGIGIPVIAMRTPSDSARDDPAEQFFPPQLPVSATALVRPRHPSCERAHPGTHDDFVLELANPIRVGSILVGQQALPIARDFSAPLEYHLQRNTSNPLTGFILPASETKDDGLRWLEPYQPRKIPVVFVHGLLSDPSTWLEMVNYLRTQDWFNARYQVWGFSYATGSPFVTSAHRLRQQLRAALAMVDPRCHDAALQQMVLIGHSMGGLVAKLQVADSGNAMWNSISNVPLGSIQASEEVKQQLEQRLYFTPQPFVRRVIYIATPHAGSSLAVRGIGRISSALVRPEEESRARHQQLIEDNPGAFFGTFQKRIPTSIDLLEPNDATLQTIFDLPVQSGTTQHAIVGTGTKLWTWGQSDGVVSVDSASHPDSLIEAYIAAAHTEITKDEATIAEVARILKLHLE